MLKGIKEKAKNQFYSIRNYLIARSSKCVMNLLIRTCRIHIEGLENFVKIAEKEKCILMLWHNRLAIAPYILTEYAPHLIYAALVSGSRDGEILSTIILSYKQGRTIRVPHLGRYQALQEVIRHIEEKKEIVIITPDGPRGPRYEMKPGIAVAALETQAYVIAMDWEAARFWELKTWDRFRIPKPFTTISFKFLPPIRLGSPSEMSLEQAKDLLFQNIPIGFSCAGHKHENCE